MFSVLYFAVLYFFMLKNSILYYKKVYVIEPLNPEWSKIYYVYLLWKKKYQLGHLPV